MRHQSTKVLDYVQDTNGKREWYIPQTNDVRIEQQLQIIRKEIQDVEIGRQEEMDILTCRFINNKRLNINLAIHWLTKDLEIVNDELWSQVWTKGLLPKVSFFL